MNLTRGQALLPDDGSGAARDRRGTVIAALKARGLATAILSNGSPPMLAAAVASAGIGSLLDDVLSVESVGVFKPDARVYGLVTERFGCARDEVLFVSSNGWDAAAAAGSVGGAASPASSAACGSRRNAAMNRLRCEAFGPSCVIASPLRLVGRRLAHVAVSAAMLAPVAMPVVAAVGLTALAASPASKAGWREGRLVTHTAALPYAVFQSLVRGLCGIESDDSPAATRLPSRASNA